MANSVTATFSIAAVPRPIAAAGLPGVVALIGFAAWRRCRSMAVEEGSHRVTRRGRALLSPLALLKGPKLIPVAS